MRASPIRGVAVAAGLFVGADHALAQLDFVSRNGMNICICGDPFDGPSVSHTFTTPDEVHDMIAISAGGSEATASFDAIPSSRGLSLHFVGSASRTPVTRGAADGRDFWAFTIDEPVEFALDVSLNAASSDGFVQSLAFVLVTSDGRIDLSDGNLTRVLSTSFLVPVEWSERYTGTLQPGRYDISLFARVEGGSGFWSGSYDVSLALELGCAGDFNGDGNLNVFDFLAYQSAYSSDDASADLAPPQGILNVFDFLAFQTAFSEGC